MDEKYLEMADALNSDAVADGIARARLKATKPEKFNGTCRECEGAEVPPARIELGYFNCIACAQSAERREQFRRATGR